jgi:hypothetical protein
MGLTCGVLFAPEITHRFQTARVEVRALLLQCILPWLENMELVATSVPPATPLSYIMVHIIIIEEETKLLFLLCEIPTIFFVFSITPIPEQEAAGRGPVQQRQPK